MYLYHSKNWPNFKWDTDTLAPYVANVHNLKGTLLSRMERVDSKIREGLVLETLTEDIVSTSEIEGELLNPLEVRLSVA